MDTKDFNKYIEFGAGYFARLIEILTDINFEGTPEGDEFMLKSLQALVVNHEIESLSK